MMMMMMMMIMLTCVSGKGKELEVLFLACAIVRYTHYFKPLTHCKYDLNPQFFQ